VPDFLVRTTGDETVWIVETKGREELDLPQKMARLRQWCADATAAEQQNGNPVRRYDFVFVDQTSFHKHPPSSFAGVVAAFREYKDVPSSPDPELAAVFAAGKEMEAAGVNFDEWSKTSRDVWR
jgi:hypothetical protein